MKAGKNKSPLFLLLIGIYYYILIINNMEGKQKIQLTKEDINSIVNECVKRCLTLNEDMTRSQVENQIDDYMNSKEFEKRVHNIAVDVVSEFIENMWLKKSFWKTMIRKK